MDQATSTAARQTPSVNYELTVTEESRKYQALAWITGVFAVLMASLAGYFLVENDRLQEQVSRYQSQAMFQNVTYLNFYTCGEDDWFTQTWTPSSWSTPLRDDGCALSITVDLPALDEPEEEDSVLTDYCPSYCTLDDPVDCDFNDSCCC